MTSPNFKDHFSELSHQYATYRPRYPMALVDALANITLARHRALDVGCGSGQLSVLLAEKFDEVIAIDGSAAQIAQAQPHDRVTYRTAIAEATGLAAASVDLITVAQAVHWLDLEKFYTEVHRIARPGAVLALITYGLPRPGGELQRLIDEFYLETVGPYWPPERRLVEDGYQSLPFPFKEVSLPGLTMETHWNLADLIGYLNTWSAVKIFRQTTGADPLESITPRLAAAWGDAEVQRTIHWPLAVRAAKVS